MTEEDPFHIDAEANESVAAEAEALAKAGQESRTAIVDYDPEHGAEVPPPSRETGFAMIAEVVQEPKQRMLLFTEIGTLLDEATEAVINRSRIVAAKAGRVADKAVVGSLLAIGLVSATADEAQAFDLKKHIPGILQGGARGYGMYKEYRAQEHRNEAAALRYMEERTEDLINELVFLDRELEGAVAALKEAKTPRQRETIQNDIIHMQVMRNGHIGELMTLQDRLREAARKGKTSLSEEQKAHADERQAEIAERIAWEVSWSHTWGF